MALTVTTKNGQDDSKRSNKMTDQNKMPDEISLFRCSCEGDIKWSEDSSDALAIYVNENLYTAVVAERDQLRALCEGMSESMNLVRSIISEGSNTGFNYKNGDWPDRLYKSQGDTYKALTAYEQYKETHK